MSAAALVAGDSGPEIARAAGTEPLSPFGSPVAGGEYIGVRPPEAARRSPAGPHPPGVFTPKELPIRLMCRYRYRTATLVGPWRDSLLKAETDAVAIGQAKFDGRCGRFEWSVPGEIEVSRDEPDARNRG